MQDKSTQNQSISSVKRPTRHRKRSKRRSIYCKIHSCYLDSASPKYRLSALSAKSDQEKEKLTEFLLSLSDEQRSEDIRKNWVEAFWCPQCQATQWHHVTVASAQIYHTEVLANAFCSQLKHQD